MPGNITSANAVYMLGIASVFPIPVQLQQFATDNIFDTEEIEVAEIQMGVDGFLSAGFVFVPSPQVIHLQGDSDSNLIFDVWQQTERAAKTKFRATATISLPAIGRQWTMINGVLHRFKPMPDAHRTLTARPYRITWESATPSPL